jgi:uncharacterized protein (AIM24 family)
MMPGDTEEDALNEANLIGEESFGTFWAGSGLGTLMEIVYKEPEVLTIVQIKTDKGKTLTVEQFLSMIYKLKVKFNQK